MQERPELQRRGMNSDLRSIADARTFNELKKSLATELMNYEIDLNNQLNREREKTYQEFVARQYAYEKKFNKQKADLLSKGKKEEAKALKKEYDKRLADEKKFIDALSKYKEDDARKQYLNQLKELKKLSNEELKQYGISRKDVNAQIKATQTEAERRKDFLEGLSKFTQSLSAMLDSKIDEIASYTGKWNTRLLGTGKTFKSVSDKVNLAAGGSPIVELNSVYSNIDKLVDKGISYNVAQRAFLESVKDDIASTFEVANGTLLQLIRIQRTDSTAIRMGMEASLNKYFNKMFQNTEYLNDMYDSVSGSLYEATALLTGNEGAEFEYQVQKWLGSMYSAGISQQAVGNIASALGQLGSGNLTGMSDSMQNLFVMAAGRAGLNYSDLLTGGLNAQNTNALLSALVSYANTMNEGDNRIVKSQLANVFGLTTSDLKALANLSTNIQSITSNSLSASGAQNNLLSLLGTMGMRMSTGEMMGNLWNNTQYSIAANIGNSPVLYGLWKASNILTDVMEGIAIPALSVVGNMVDLETNVASLMKVGALSGGLLGSMGSMITGLTTMGAGGLAPFALLGEGGIGSTIGQIKGSLQDAFSGLIGSSSKSYQGNSSGDMVYEQTMSDADTQKLQLQEENKSDEKTSNDIYNLLNDLLYMNSSIKVCLTNIQTLDPLHVIVDGNNFTAGF